MAKSMCKSEFHSFGVFSTRALLRQGHHVKHEFCTLQQQQGSTWRLKSKMITTIRTLDDSMLGDNLIMSQQVDYMSTPLILDEAVENNQEHLVANKVGSIMPLVLKLFVLKKP